VSRWSRRNEISRIVVKRGGTQRRGIGGRSGSAGTVEFGLIDVAGRLSRWQCLKRRQLLSGRGLFCDGR
jgi:hypothetical protein